MIPCTQHSREIKELQEKIEVLESLIKTTAEAVIMVAKSQNDYKGNVETLTASLEQMKAPGPSYHW